MARQRPKAIEVQKFLSGMSYPCSKEELLACAKSSDAPRDVMDELEHLSDQRFNSPADVSKAVGH